MINNLGNPFTEVENILYIPWYKSHLSLRVNSKSNKEILFI